MSTHRSLGVHAPATPLWVHSPYVNWLMPADNATGDWVWHVRNDKVGSMTAAVRVDGKVFGILGPLGAYHPPTQQQYV